VVKRGHEMHRLLFVAGFLICTAALDAEQMAGLAAAQELPPGVKTFSWAIVTRQRRQVEYGIAR